MDTTTGDDGYDVLREVRNLMAGIEFDDEHPAPASQRVRTFLADAVSSGWFNARVTSYQAPGGAGVHLAFAKMEFLRGEALIVVVEAADGSLSIPFPLASDALTGQDHATLQFSIVGEQEQEGDETTYEEEKFCVMRIMRAFREISKIVAASDAVKHRKKTRLLNEITHAASHLTRSLERIKRQQ